MSNKEVMLDMRGKACPEPVIEAKKAMDADGTTYVKVLVDNDVSRDNVVKLGEYRGYENHVLEQEGNYIVVLIPPTVVTEELATASALDIQTSNDLDDLDLEDIFENEFAAPLGKVITNTTIAGGDAPFYMTNGTGSLERSIAAYEKMKAEKAAMGAPITQEMESPEMKMPTPVMPAQGVGDKVLLLTKDYLGEGSEELGRNLMKSFLYVLTEADVKPKAIYCINSAVNMLVEGSEHIENFKALESAGVTIGGCGICLDFYEVKDKVQVGTVTNLYAITESMMQEPFVTL
ncbi:sulfurtransferase-like selenium metabolism protein YedF [Veillonella sp. CHU740]|uniref:sulfurtransferase-like selenium metabolism protein YedF n=1 Tax=Veillonella sp. CHU740 TaxID=2490950 RepID=UPI000F8F1AE1|nr:sulfurtransferase-like selenium metabolism protein YedF [Veillonella sp. CHU740]